MTPSHQDELVRHAEALRRLARRLVGGSGPWEDLVQGTFLAGLERAPKSLSLGWLAQVLRNRACDHHRRQGVMVVESDKQDLIASGGANPEAPEILERIEVHGEIVAAVGALAEPYRSTVFLRFFDDLTPTEIARRQGVPVKTVKTRLSRGMAHLRERLDRKLDPKGQGGLAALVPLAFPQKLTPLAPAGGLSSSLGAGIMIKKVALVCVVALGVLGVYHSQQKEPPANEPAGLALPENTELPKLEVDPEQKTPERVAAGQGRQPAAVTPAIETPEVASGLGTLVVHVSTADGDPLAEVFVGVRTSFPDGPSVNKCFEATDDAGVLRVEGLQPGSHYVFSDLGGNTWANVVAGEQTRVQLTLKETLDVQGLVVGGDGRPVAGADIWLANGSRSWMGGRVVTQANAEGEFHLPRTPKGTSLGALAPDHAPSPLVDLDLADLTQSPVEVRLVMTGAAGFLSGFVLDPDGAPVADAHVAIGRALAYIPMRLGPGRVEVWAPRRVRTDAAGHFRMSGLALGPQRVTVQAEGHPIVQEEFEVLAGGTPSVEVILPKEAWIEGRVMNSAGVPVSGAFVRAFDQSPTNLDESYVDRAQFDYSGTFSFPFAKTDADGHYVISGVRPGNVIVFANPPDDDTKVLPFDREEIVVVADQRYSWDAVLSTGLSIQGSVEFKNGDPVAEIHVIARNEQSGKHFSCVTDEHGTFELIQLEDTSHTVWVQLWPRLDTDKAEAMQKSNVRPSGAPVNFVASVDDQPPVEYGIVIAKVDDRAQRLTRGGGAMLNNLGASSFQNSAIQNGTVLFDHVEPGTYQLVFTAGMNAVLASDVFEVASGEDVDLGTLVTQPAGSALLRLTRPSGTENVALTLGCQMVGNGWMPHEVGAVSEHRFEDLGEGSYILRLRGDGVADLDLPFEVHSGEETILNYTLEPAVTRTIEVWRPEGVDMAEANIRIDFEGGRRLEEWTWSRSRVVPQPMTGDLEIPLGRFTILVVATGGFTGSAQFEMTSLEPGQAPIRVDLE